MTDKNTSALIENNVGEATFSAPTMSVQEALSQPNVLDKSFSRSLKWQLVGLFIVSALVVFGTIASDKQLDKIMPETKTFASVNNLKPSGLSAFFELCHKVFSGRKVSEWEMPYRKLRGANRNASSAASGVLIIVSPDESLAEFEVEDILDWVRDGNSLVYLDDFQFRNTKRMLDRLHISARELSEALTDKQSDGRRDLPEYTHLRVLNVSAKQRLSGGDSIVSVNDNPVIVQKKYGKGLILVGSCPQMVSNRQITMTDHWSNFQFLHNWLATKSGAIYFDEKCHGSSKGTNVLFYFLHGPTGLVALQIILILTIAVISAHQRFGAIVPLKNIRRISNLEYIEGLSNTYLRAHARQAVISILWQNARQKLCKVLQISPREEDEKLNETLQNQRSLATTKVVEMVQQCEEAVKRKDLSDEELQELVAACDKITEQAEGLLTTNRPD